MGLKMAKFRMLVALGTLAITPYKPTKFGLNPTIITGKSPMCGWHQPYIGMSVLGNIMEHIWKYFGNSPGAYQDSCPD